MRYPNDALFEELDICQAALLVVRSSIARISFRNLVAQHNQSLFNKLKTREALIMFVIYELGKQLVYV
jgi:hypothetical protein